MARGKKTDNETIYKVMLSYITTNNYSETARQLNMAESTVRKIIDDNKDKEEFAKLCEQKREDFVKKADKIIDKALSKLDKGLDKDDIAINHLSTVIGTIYDKRALAKGESTSNENITVRVELTDD